MFCLVRLQIDVAERLCCIHVAESVWGANKEFVLNAGSWTTRAVSVQFPSVVM